jgi:hypothetical protein
MLARSSSGDTHARTQDLAILVAATGELLVKEQSPSRWPA